MFKQKLHSNNFSYAVLIKLLSAFYLNNILHLFEMVLCRVFIALVSNDEKIAFEEIYFADIFEILYFSLKINLNNERYCLS